MTNAADSAMDRLAGLVSRILGSPVGLVSLVDDTRQFFPGQQGLPDPLSVHRQTPLEQSLCRTVVATREVLQIDDTSADPRWAEHGAHTVLGVISYLGAPLLDSENRVLGSLCAIGVEPRSWTVEDRQTLQDLSIAASSELQARIAVSEATTARVAAELARARIETMADVSTALISTMDPGESIERMLDVLVDRFAVWAYVFVAGTVDSKPQLFARHRRDDLRSVVDELTSKSTVRLQEMALTRSVLEGVVPSVNIGLDDALAAGQRAGSTTPIFETLGIGPLIIVPMSVGDDIVGALAVFGDPLQAPYGDVDVALCSDLAQRAAMTFEHARLYAREHRVAFELQHSLLPELPVVVGIESDAVYRAAAHGVDVGGDWYDLIDMGDGSIIASVGDVTGHNIQAAAAMGRVQSALRIFAAAGLRPAAMIDRVASVATAVLGELLATCLVAELAPRGDGDWTISVANAGHLPPVVVDPDGTARLVELQPDPLLGSPSRRQRSTTTITAAEGSTIILYTDGLVEHRLESIDVSIERLCTAASVEAVGPVDGLCKRLVDAIRPDGRDDIACIAIRL